MARPQKQTVDYFPHYSNASSGKTLYILESKFGNDGYAFWFKLLEILANSQGHFYDARNPVAWEFLLAKTHVVNEKAEQIMGLLVDLDAIDSKLWDKRIIWCQNLVDNITDAYRNRTTDIPLKPSINGKEPLCIGVSDVRNEVSDVRSTQTILKDNILDNNKEVIVDDNNIIEELQSLSRWGATHSLEDAQWLVEFLAEYPLLTDSHIKACRDFHSNKMKHNKALWKTRLRNWMKKDREFLKGGQDGTHRQNSQRLTQRDSYTKRPPDPRITRLIENEGGADESPGSNELG